jgi:hypothetical protein
MSLHEKGRDVFERVEARLRTAKANNDRTKINKYENQLKILQYTQDMLEDSDLVNK